MCCRFAPRRHGAWWVLSCYSLFALLVCMPARGEGGDKRVPKYDWGVNRRVRTIVANPENPGDPGYVGVAGTFTVNAPISIPTDEHGVVSLISNPFNCGYSFYLGGGKNAEDANGSGGLEVDAGLQWEDLDAQERRNQKKQQHNPLNPYLVGWTAFINNSRPGSGDAYTNPEKRGAKGFETWRGHSLQPAYDLTYMVTPEGYLGLTIAGPDWPGGTFYWENDNLAMTGLDEGLGRPDPAAGEQVIPAIDQLLALSVTPPPNQNNGTQTVLEGDEVVYNGTEGHPAEFGSLFVKRSTCITQATGVTGRCDGTKFDCTFSGGLVYHSPTSALSGPVASPWVENICNQIPTGYDVEECGSNSIDQSFNGMATPGSLFKLAFPLLGKPARHAGSEAIYPGRYSSEDVHISLINGAWGDGSSRVAPSSP